MLKRFIPILVIMFMTTIFFTQHTQAVSEWDEAVTVYGAALENDQNLQTQTAEVLGVEDNDIISYVYREDSMRYLNQDYANNILKSSIRIQQRNEGHGLDLTINEEMGRITQITPQMYQNALITSGITDAVVVIGAAEDVTGESALAGIYKAFAEQGEEVNEEYTQNAQQELNVINNITQQNINVDGFSQEQLNKMITEIKINIIDEGGDLSEEQIRNIVNDQMERNGLDGILTETQVNNIINIVIQIQNSGIFQSEEANRLLDSSRDLVNQITSSDAFDQAKEQAAQIGKEIQESGVWQNFLNALQDFIDLILNFFRSN
ncbi:DUF1002 domain-containing protein [Aliicoccus persicus]|uniref:Uncharacterized protein YpuA, DUF1002 family n=1 Tax=Aliicoccus persicus TaxID=930138 RepID=A0A662Z2K7_9STAP|nr:DUF1002 domain-containing protein [Aliicoccus persicus]SEV82755.1 Uncharacterized protein YpuA, DUF1002 family [Aliicoccus persicus]